MTHRLSAPTRVRGALRPTILPLVIVLAAIIGSLVVRSAASSGKPSVIDVRPPDAGHLPTTDTGTVGSNDGVLPGGVTVFDDDRPGVANLDTGLLRALRRAAKDAARDGVELHVTSGWRSRRYQDQLLREAISQYGSRAEAARWVATADTSPHVSGDAVDVGPVGATAWLARHGAQYGLCPVYRNEPWHYELRPESVRHGCPRMYADPTHDPRLRE